MWEFGLSLIFFFSELPGFYYDEEKNRYFPIKGPIPGAKSSSSSRTKQKPEPKPEQVSLLQIQLFQVYVVKVESCRINENSPIFSSLNLFM
jgi:hypothetical protein